MKNYFVKSIVLLSVIFFAGCSSSKESASSDGVAASLEDGNCQFSEYYMEGEEGSPIERWCNTEYSTDKFYRVGVGESSRMNSAMMMANQDASHNFARSLAELRGTIIESFEAYYSENGEYEGSISVVEYNEEIVGGIRTDVGCITVPGGTGSAKCYSLYEWKKSSVLANFEENLDEREAELFKQFKETDEFKQLLAELR